MHRRLGIPKKRERECEVTSNDLGLALFVRFHALAAYQSASRRSVKIVVTSISFLRTTEGVGVVLRRPSREWPVPCALGRTGQRE
jgi:hypothetical protein